MTPQQIHDQIESGKPSPELSSLAKMCKAAFSEILSKQADKNGKTANFCLSGIQHCDRLTESKQTPS